MVDNCIDYRIMILYGYSKLQIAEITIQIKFKDIVEDLAFLKFMEY